MHRALPTHHVAVAAAVGSRVLGTLTLGPAPLRAVAVAVRVAVTVAVTVAIAIAVAVAAPPAPASLPAATPAVTVAFVAAITIVAVIAVVSAAARLLLLFLVPAGMPADRAGQLPGHGPYQLGLGVRAAITLGPEPAAVMRTSFPGKGLLVDAGHLTPACLLRRRKFGFV